MKFIALRDFRNHNPEDVKVEGAKHVNHVHKGALLEIGRGATLKDLSKQDQELVALLSTYARAIGDASKKELVEQIKAEVEIETKAEQRAAKAAAKTAVVAG